MTNPRSGAPVALAAAIPGLLPVLYCLNWFRSFPSPTAQEYYLHGGWLAVVAGIVGGLWTVFMLVGALVELTPSRPPRPRQPARPIQPPRLRPGLEPVLDHLARPFALGLALSLVFLYILFWVSSLLLVPAVVIALAGIPFAGITLFGLFGAVGSK